MQCMVIRESLGSIMKSTFHHHVSDWSCPVPALRDVTPPQAALLSLPGTEVSGKPSLPGHSSTPNKASQLPPSPSHPSSNTLHSLGHVVHSHIVPHIFADWFPVKQRMPRKESSCGYPPPTESHPSMGSLAGNPGSGEERLTQR